MSELALEQFMESQGTVGLTFDDVSLSTAYADFDPSDVSIQSQFSRRIRLNAPFVSASMDTVTESRMAIAMALSGGIGVIHKNLSIADQANEVKRVKSYLNGLIEKPVVFPKDGLLSELLAERDRQQYSFSGFPIIDKDDRLCGILTAQDIKFVRDSRVPVAEVMSRKLITAPVGTTLQDAFQIMLKHKIGKLPIVNEKRQLAGLYSLHDVKSLISNVETNINRDRQHKLRVAAAVSPQDYRRVEALVAEGVDAIVIDTAHGHTKNVRETVQELKRVYSEIDVVAGNIATGTAAKSLLDLGVDAVKVGIGPGSICTTRVVCGVGVPQITAIYNVWNAIRGEIPIIADGGVRYSGDVPKALAAGADSVMMGSVLAGTQESPGEKIVHQGRSYVIYRGMGSLEAMKHGKGSRERYNHEDVEDDMQFIPQGIEGLVPFRGLVEVIIIQFSGGLKFAMGYCGTRTLKELRRQARFIRVSSAGLREAHPHDVTIIKDASNYNANYRLNTQ